MQLSIWSSLFALVALTCSAALAQAQTNAPFSFELPPCFGEVAACIPAVFGVNATSEDLEAATCDDQRAILNCYQKLVDDEVEGCAEILDETTLGALQAAIDEECTTFAPSTLAPPTIDIPCFEEAAACVSGELGTVGDIENAGCGDLRAIISCYEELVSDDVEGCKAFLDTAQAALDEDCSASACLSGDMLVETMSGMKLTKDLSVGDMVSVGSGKYEPVVWNSQHYEGNDNVRATFVEFELSNGEKVAMTPAHFAKTIDGPILAGNVKVGQVMMSGQDEAVLVESIERTTKQGVYNPQTPSQQIEVNGIVVTTRSKDSPSFMGAIFQVLAFFHSLAPSAVYSTVIENICHFVYEPLMFGQNAWALPVATLIFAVAGVKASKA